MGFEYRYSALICVVLLNYFTFIEGRGVFLLYRPLDLTKDCVLSQKIRYDISFGMGMSDTISVVLRTLPDIDYQCEIDISTEYKNKLIVVIRFPNNVGYNCEMNPDAFHVMKKMDCYALCNELDEQDLFNKYWVLYTSGRFRFQFRSNSSLNNDMNALLYEVTVTTARIRGKNQTCLVHANETECYAPPPYDQHYCMTSGIECDGIMNCGADNWYDERRSECEIPIHHLSYPPILAIVAIIFFSLLAGCHVLQRCLPRGTSFFIFNTNEDNRLCVDPLLTVRELSTFDECDTLRRKKSLIPVDSDTSLDDSETNDPNITDLGKLSPIMSDEEKADFTRKSTKAIRIVSQSVQRLRSVADRFASRTSVARTVALEIKIDKVDTEDKDESVEDNIV